MYPGLGRSSKSIRDILLERLVCPGVADHLRLQGTTADHEATGDLTRFPAVMSFVDHPW